MVYARVVSVLSNSGTGTQNITFTGGTSFTPKLAIFQWSRANTSSDTFQEHMSNGYGFTDGTNQRCIAVSSEDNQARSDTASIQRNDAVICTLNPTGTVAGVDALATFSSWLTDGIQINWTDAPAAQFYLTVTLIGGNDLTNIDIGTILTTTGGSASLSSLSWQPENGIFLAASGTTTENSPVSHGIMCLGAYDGTTQWTQGYLAQDNPVTMITRQNYQHDRVMDIPTTAGATNGYSTIAWTSNGFTLTNTDTYSASLPIYYCVWKGGTCVTGYATEPGSVSQQTITTNEDVQAVMVFGVDSGTAGWQNGAMWTSGMATSTTERYVDVFEDTNGVADSIVVSRHDTDQLYLNITSNATASSSTLDDEATFYSKSATNVVLNWTNIGQARPFRYITLGGIPPTQVSTTKTHKYNVSNAVSTTKTHKYNILNKVSTTKTHKYNVSEAVEPTFRSETVSVLSNSGTGTQNITHSGNWTPKVAIVQWSRANTSTNTFQEHASIGYGFTDGTNSRCVAFTSEDNQPNSDTANIQRNDALICTLNPTGTVETVDAVATFSQWLSNGMQISWSDAPAAQFYITVLFLGGSDITNATVGTLMTGTSTGQISETGLAYQPDIGMFLCGGTITENSPVVGGSLAVGAGKSNSARWVQSIYSQDNVATMTTRNVYSPNNVVLTVTTTLTGYADLVSYNSNGFTLSVTDAFPASYPIYYLVIKGGSYSVGTATEPASTQQQTITTNTDVKAVGIFGLDNSTQNSTQNGCMFTSGFGDSSLNQYCNVFEDTNGALDSVVVSRHDTDQIYLNITSNSTATNSTLDDEASLSAVSSTGFTLDWTNIGQARPFRYITFGEAPLTQVSTTKTHKYNIVTKVTASRTHKYNLSTEVSATRTHKYNISTEVETTKTHKYNIIGKVTTSKTHKYNILNKVESTKTHKYNIVNKITASRTHKYTITNAVSTTKTHKFSILNRVDTTKTHKYSIINKVEGVSKTHLFNLLNKVETTKTHKYNVLEAQEQVVATKTHKYNIAGQITSSHTHKWHIEGKITTSKTHLFSILNKISTTKTHLYNLVTRITPSKTHKFNILERIQLSTAHLYHIEGKVTVSKTHKWNVLNSIATTKTHLYGILNAVSTSKTHLFSILEQISVSKTHKYNVEGGLTQVSTTKTHKFNILTKISASRTHKFNILEQITASRTHKFNISLRITPDASKTHKFNILGKVTASKTHKFNIISRISVTRTHRWDSGGKVLVTKRHNYNIGLAYVPPVGAGSSTVAHIKFPERVRIIDIISDIRNKVIADVELFNKDKIICRAVVELADPLFPIAKIANASGKARHRISSRLIIPQVLDTIENHAVSGRIGIEVLPLSQVPQLQLHSKIQLLQSQVLYLQSQTQIKEDPTKLIRLSSTTELIPRERIASMAKLELSVLNDIKLKAPEIMSREREQTIKRIIKILENEQLFK